MVQEHMDTFFKRQQAQLQSMTAELLEDQNARLDPLVRRPPKSRHRFHSEAVKSRQRQSTSNNSEGVAVNVGQYVSVCMSSCVCACHRQVKVPGPAFINRLLGHLFVGAAGIPLLSPKCNTPTCQSSQAPRVSVEYWFPIGVFWSQMVKLQVEYHASTGPQFSLRSLRRVPDSSQCVHYAQIGDIEGLKHLFKHGLASPWDVSSTRGDTLVRWALYSKQYKTAKFLTLAGSDADYKPIANTDNSARHKAFDNLLQGGLDAEAEDDIRCLTAGSDWIEEQQMSNLHKIIINVQYSSLEDALAEQPYNVDIRDNMGRTPLVWAAARGDHQAVQLLLDHGADPNVMDMYLAPPVSYAADRGHTLCVKLLLEAGAKAEPKLPPGVKLGSPLNCAARNTNDPTLLRYLLTYGAEVDATGVDGNTALIHACRTDNVRFAALLMDWNADLNAININQQTPLTTAIMSNSHNVLELLLEHWEEFSTCPRLKGPHLLEITACYADLETVTLLEHTDHLKLKYDANYSVRDFAKSLSGRADVTDELVAGFDRLLHIVDQSPELTRPLNSMEKDLEKRSALATKDGRLSIYASECPYSNDLEKLGDDYKDGNGGLNCG